MFKKREVKGNRKKIESGNDDNSETNGEDDGINFAAISEVKERQQQRKRIKHEFSELQLVDDSNSKIIGKSEAVKSIEGMMSSQFLARSNDDSKAMTHENVMEKYISEKLGLLV